MKDLKPMLKEARDAIKNKNYETAMKLCKQILKEDKSNYMALVFLGVSLQENGQTQKALIAFQNAIQLNPSNTLAWNGLVNYYDKLDTKEAKTELVKAYLSLLSIETVEKKLREYTQKLEQLSEFGDTAELATAIDSLIKSGKCVNTIELSVSQINILSKVKNLSTDLLLIYEDALKAVLTDQKTVCTKYYGDYLNFLYKQERLKDVFDNAKKMRSLFEMDHISLKWICKIFNEFYVELDTMLGNREEITCHYKNLLKVEPQSATALFTQSILLVEDKQLTEAKYLLDRVVNILPGLLHAWILLSKCCINLLLFSDAIQAVTKIDKLLQPNTAARRRLKNKTDLLLIEALSRSDDEKDLRRVLEINDTICNEMRAEIIVHVIRANINIGNFDVADVLLSELKNNSEDLTMFKLLSAQLLRRQGKPAEALRMLENEDVSLSEWWLEVGTLYWDADQHEKSLMPYLKATKLNSSNYKCFLYLGHYYKWAHDLDKARRCYEKSFKINTKCSEAGVELSIIYRKLKNWDANLALLQSLTAGVINRKNSWAWMELGLHYLEQQDYDKALANLRYVIRMDENNLNCWESLADAYLAKGAYTSALKCYEKASDLSQSALYPLLQMANIKQVLGEYVEARSVFEEILSSNQHYVPALKGMAETCLSQAKDCFKSQRFGMARDHSQCAANKLIIAIQQRSDLSCLWKLLGNSCIFVTNLPHKFCHLSLPASFLEDSGGKRLEEKDLYSLAIKCYCKSLALIEDNILIWHDLGVAYLFYALSTDNDSCEELMTKAQGVAQFCTSKNSTCWQHWNLLGNIAISLNPPNYRLAQHSLIKAVIADRNSAMSWSNLGTLYFMLGDLKLANEAFSQAQRSDPNYVNSWIGQALLAESLRHEDAMDLFRHSTQLGIHTQGALGYAHWVCQTLKKSPLDAVVYSIHNMHAIPVACDVVTWYTEHNLENSAAWNMLGILKERMGLHLGALEAFKNALRLADNDKRDLARLNYGRLLSRLGKYADAIAVFSKIETATFNSGSGLALALFKDKHYKESYESYESTLHWLSEEPHYQSDLLVALAAMAYMFEGPEAAKTLLFQSIQLGKPSPWSFYATLALGLLHNDSNLAELVFNELTALKDRKDCLQHYAVLCGYFYLLNGDTKKAVYEISKVVHRYPDQASVWLALSSLLIRLQKQKSSSKAAAKCAQVAMKLGQTNMDVTKVLCLVSLSSFLAGDGKSALLSAQKAVHCYPDVAEAWAVLGSALLATKTQTSYTKEVLKHATLCNKSEELEKWLQKTIRLI